MDTVQYGVSGVVKDVWSEEVQGIEEGDALPGG
jgi:hypothetical protein